MVLTARWRVVAFLLLVLALIAFVIYALIGRGTLTWAHPAEYLGFGLAFTAAALIIDHWPT